MLSDRSWLDALVRPGFHFHDERYYFADSVEVQSLPPGFDPTDPNGWSFWRGRNFEFFSKEMAAARQNAVLADVGAGHSDFRALYERFRVVTVDHCAYPGVNVVADINVEIPLQDGSVDLVMLSNVLEHLYEPQRMLSECRRIIAPGGRLLGSVPFFVPIHQRPYDFYRYTDIALSRLLSDAGFAGVEVEPVVSPYAVFRVSAELLFRSLIQRYRERTDRSRWLALPLRIHWFLFRWLYLRLGRPLVHFDQNGDCDAPLGYHFKAMVL